MDTLISLHLLKRFLYLLLVIAIALSINRFFLTIESSWLLWSVAMLALIMEGATFRRRLISVVKLGVMMMASILLAGLIAKWPIITILYFVLLAGWGAYTCQYHPDHFWAVIITVLSGLLSGLMPTTVLDLFMRVNSVLIATGIVLIAQFIFYPYFVRNELRSLMVKSLTNLQKINASIFDCLIDPEYVDNIYLYERRVHDRKKQWMRVMGRIRESLSLLSSAMSHDERVANEKLVGLQEKLYENMMDFGQLRRRVTDYTSLSVCSQEFNEIANEINRLFNSVIKHFYHQQLFANESVLEMKIKRLDDSYHHVLQVAVREPLVFLLFIDSLNAFCETIHQLSEAVIPKSSGYA